MKVRIYPPEAARSLDTGFLVTSLSEFTLLSVGLSALWPVGSASRLRLKLKKFIGEN